MKRCFGVDKKVAECDSSYLATLKSLRQPHQPMPRLSELLHFIGRPENEAVWLLLDVKARITSQSELAWRPANRLIPQTDDDPEELLSKTAETIASIPTSRPWKERVVLGGWNVRITHHPPRLTQHCTDKLAYTTSSLREEILHRPLQNISSRIRHSKHRSFTVRIQISQRNTRSRFQHATADFTLARGETFYQESEEITAEVVRVDGKRGALDGVEYKEGSRRRDYR